MCYNKIGMVCGEKAASVPIRKAEGKMGKFIVVDGLDGSGKNTQTRLLAAALEEAGRKVISLSYPRYGTAGAKPLEAYLSGGLGGKPGDTGAVPASVLFAVDRYLSYRTEWAEAYEKPDTVILADRYTSANAVHQLSKLPKEEWDSFLSWLWDFEFHKMGIPEPDQVIYLEVPPTVSLSLVEKRHEESGRTVDIHESDRAYMLRCYEAALYASEKLGWTCVSCAPDGVMRDRSDIHDEIMKKLIAL